jgi:hypothetical protein
MDKQFGTTNEMVEEMAKGMCEHCIENEEFTCSIAPQPCVFAKTFAENLYNAGYRKIPEDAVVLTREEAEQVCGTVKAHGELLKYLQEAKSVFEEEMKEAQKEFVKRLEEDEKEIRKETAEKFAERVSKAFIGLNCIDIDEWNWCQRKIDEICKEFTEGKV